jgi:hypothetical protein
LEELNNTNDDEELSSMVDQFKEIALRVGSRSCVMTTQIAKLQREKDVLAKQLEETKSQLLNQEHK